MPARQVLDPPLVTVRFQPGKAPTYGTQATTEIAQRTDADWAALEGLFPGLRLLPLFRCISAQEIQALVRRGKRLTPRYQPARFLDMFQVRLPPKSAWQPSVPRDHDVAATISQLMTQSLPIDHVSIETVLAPLTSTTQISDGAVTPTAAELHHLHEAPKGIGVESAWVEPGGQGEGEVFAVVERGWKMDHVDFLGEVVADNLLMTPVTGDMRDVDVPHGTRALGVVASRKNDQYTIGVAPLAAEVRLASEWDSSTDECITENAIMAALASLVTEHPGSVLLIEVSRKVNAEDETPDILGPVETKLEIYAAIQLAVANHIVVIEPAGNGADDGSAGFDLDVIPSPFFGDSGAIMVGQSVWSPLFSNAADAAGCSHVAVNPAVTGKRINCFAWGDRVFTASAADTGAKDVDGSVIFSDSYDPYFLNTSAASAIVAGTAIVVQSIYRQMTGGYLSPSQMRLLLGETTAGANTHLGSGVVDHIGVMPDLGQLKAALAKLPDVYIRDNVDDVGVEHDGVLCESPDIIVQRNPLPAGTAPFDAFGEGSGTEDDDDLSESPMHGSKAYVYVRLRNRGGSLADGATVNVYWSTSGTLQQPAVWLNNVVGSTKIDVPADDTLVVAGPIEWDTVPEVGHYCFIATVEHPKDPRFIPDNFPEWDYFTNFVRVGNNVAWRNFDVIVMSAMAAIAPMSAEVAGPEEGDGQEMELRVESRLPRGAKVTIEVPEKLAKKLKKPPLGGVRLSAVPGASSRRGRLRAGGTSRLGRARLTSGDRHRVTLHVEIPPARRSRACSIALTQLHKGMPVGRYTWRFVPA